MSIDRFNFTNIFIFSGHGSQYTKMAKCLYEKNDYFKKSVDGVDEIFSKYFNYSIIKKVWSFDENNENDMKQLSEPLFAQCSLLIIQISIFKYLKNILKINPTLLAGHSFSEFFVLYICGLIDLEDACYLTFNITSLQQKTVGCGKMLAVSLSNDEFNSSYGEFSSNGIEIVCFNSQNSIVVGGNESSLNQLSNKLNENNIFNVFLNSSTVFHSSHQESIKNEILNIPTSHIKLNFNTHYPMFSTVHGKLLDFNDQFNLNQYCFENIRKPVRFTDTIQSMYTYIKENQLNPNINFIEISPNPILLYYLKQITPQSSEIQSYIKSIKYLSTLKKSMKNEMDELNQLVEKLTIKKEFNEMVLNYNINKYNQIKSNNTVQENQIFDSLLNKISILLNIKDIKLINLEISLIDWGLSSLLIVQLKNFIEKEYSCINLFTINLLQKSNIQEIFNLIRINKDTNLKINYNNEFWNSEIQLDESIKPNKNQLINYINSSGKLKVLLTGATGFIGAYLLQGLIQLDNVEKVYCLVRRKTSNTNPIESLISNMQHHQLYSQLTENQLSKIRPVIGDMSKRSFEMDISIYDKLSNKVNLILNSGANVSFSSEYFDNKEVNVFGLLELLKFAVCGSQLKRVVHLSTMTVFVNDSNIKETFDETYFPDLNQINNLNGYMQTKVVAEYLLNEAANRGIPCQLIRPPFVFSNPSSGIGNTNDYLQLITQCCYELKAYPSGFDDCHFFQVPITWLVDSILSLMNGTTDESWRENQLNIFNLTGDTKSLTYFFKILQSTFNDIQEVSYEQWIDKLLKSNHMSCVRISTFHSLDFNKFKINKNLNISSNTIKLLQQLNSNQYNSTLNQYNVTKEMVINHINYIFNK